jgi:hypothetical protein
MIQDVSDKLFERFTAAVRAELETSSAPPAHEPIQAVSFGAELLGRASLRWARHPAFWIGLAALALISWLLIR